MKPLAPSKLLALYRAGERDFARTQLIGADLRGVTLAEADFRQADLTGASLAGADLSEADFRRAHLDGATATGANLFAARLVRTSLDSADLAECNLRGAHLIAASAVKARFMKADLVAAELRGADLRDADLTLARIGGTALGALDLSTVRGLESVDHVGPSTIGIDTIYKSSGTIPPAFLRGCGVPDPFIAYMKSLSGRAIEFYSCFISHSSMDQEFVKRLYDRMRREGLRVWAAPEDMKAGRKIDHQVDEAIRVNDKLLLVLSRGSMESHWVQTEILAALERERRDGRQRLFPVGLAPFQEIRDWKCVDTDSGRDLGREVRAYFIPDFTLWKDHDAFEQAFSKLLRDLRKDELGPEDSSRP